MDYKIVFNGDAAIKVRSVSIINPATLGRESTSAWVRIGSVYEVVEIYAPAAGPATLRIVDESGAPSIWPSTMFVPQGPELSGQWGCEVVEGAVTLAPLPFLEPGFWEAYFDGDPVRRTRFNETLQALEAVSGPS